MTALAAAVEVVNSIKSRVSVRKLYKKFLVLFLWAHLTPLAQGLSPELPSNAAMPAERNLGPFG
jgi:hypothetical protein